MAVKFYVRDTMTIRSRSIFVLEGSIPEGTVRPGMAVQIVLNSSITLSFEICAIEIARHQHGQDVCLGIGYEEKDELELLQCLNIGDETLTLEFPTG